MNELSFGEGAFNYVAPSPFERTLNANFVSSQFLLELLYLEILILLQSFVTIFNEGLTYKMDRCD